MTSISSIDTSLYPGLIEGFAPKTTEPIPSFNPQASEGWDGYYNGDNYNSNSEIDLSDYYSNIRPEDLLSQAGRNVIQTAENLDNAMVSAIQNGYGVNEACNIRLAEMAYKANAYVFKVANEISTFELDV